MDATFGSDCNFRMGYLTKQSAAWAVLVSNLLMFVIQSFFLPQCMLPVVVGQDAVKQCQ
jgi:hypothetical protein